VAKIIEASAVISAKAGDMSGLDAIASKISRVANVGDQVKKSLSNMTGDAGKRIEELSRKLSLIDNFRGMSKGLDQASVQFRRAQQEATRLKGVIESATAPTRAMQTEYNKAALAVDRASRAFRDQGVATREARRALESAGIPINTIARQQAQLTSAVNSTTEAMLRQVRTRRQLGSDPVGAPLRPRTSTGPAVPLPPRRPGDLPIAEVATGVGVVGAVGKALRAGADIDSEREQARQAGWTQSEIATAEAQANDFAKRYGVSPGSAFNIIREGRPTFGGDLNTTLQNVAPFFDVATLMRQKSPGQSDEAINKSVTDLVKAGEILGYSSDPSKLTKYADFMSKMVQVHGSALRGEEVLNFAKSGKSAASGVDFEFLQSIFPSLLPEQGGDRLGTALMTFRQAMVGGKMKKRAAENLADLGLIDRGGLISTKDDDVKGVRRGAVVGADLLERNPLAWVQQHLVPAMDKKGVGAEERSAMLSTLFSDRNAEYLINLLVTQGARLEKDRTTVEKAKGLAGARDALDNDPYVLAHRLAGGAANVGAALSSPFMDPAKAAGRWIANMLGVGAEAARARPGDAAAGVMAGGSAGGILGALATNAGIIARGAAAIAGAGSGALVGGVALPFLGRVAGDTVKGLGSVAAGKYFIPTDAEGMADLQRQLVEKQAQAQGITARLHPSRRGEPNAELDALKGQIADLENRIGLGGQLRNLQSLVEFGTNPDLARLRALASPLSPELEQKRLEVARPQEAVRVVGEVASTSDIRVTASSELLRIVDEVKRIVATVPLTSGPAPGAGPGSTGTSMPETETSAGRFGRN